LQYLARSWTPHRTAVLLLLGRCSETRDLEPQMAHWLSSLSRTLALTRLQLGPLSAKDILQIVRLLSGGEGAHPLSQEQAAFQPSWHPVQAKSRRLISERFCAWLFAETKGQPFYLRALLQTLLDRGVLVPRLLAGSGWVFEPHLSLLDAILPDTILPPEVRELIQHRLTRLSPPARALLAAEAVLEQDFTFEELCQVASLCPREGLAALDEALQNLLLQESSHRREGSSGVVLPLCSRQDPPGGRCRSWGCPQAPLAWSRAHDPGARGPPHRRAGLPRARQRINRAKRCRSVVFQRST
jgi:predicted ATPase